MASLRAPRSGDPASDLPPIPLGRRIGVIAVVGALAGSILLGTGILESGTASTTPSPIAAVSPSPGLAASAPATPTVLWPVPVIAAPEQPRIARRSWDAQVSFPGAEIPLRGLEVHIYRNGNEVGARRLQGPAPITLEDVPLVRGRNRMTAALSGDLGTGPRSEAVVIVVDDLPPRLDLRDPREGDTVDTASVTVRGITEPGTSVRLRNESTGAARTVTAGDDGTFRGELPLAAGRNTISARAADDLGNAASRTIHVQRGDGVSRADLKLTPEAFRLRGLPAQLDVRLELTDSDGRPVDGASVTFSLSPPGLPTTTYQAISADGVATWRDITLPREGAVVGEGFVTARVTLPGGEVVQTSEPFQIR